MSIAVFPVLGIVLLIVSLVASAVGSMLLARAGRLRQAGRGTAPSGRADVLGVLVRVRGRLMSRQQACGTVHLRRSRLILGHGWWLHTLAGGPAARPSITAEALR